jgi:hypothetical protein
VTRLAKEMGLIKDLDVIWATGPTYVERDRSQQRSLVIQIARDSVSAVVTISTVMLTADQIEFPRARLPIKPKSFE